MPPAYVCLSRRGVQNTKVLDTVQSNPSASTRWVGCETGLSQCVECHEEQLYSFHVQLVQGLQPGASNLCHQLCRWLQHKTVDEPNFLSCIEE
jgi:hypothetical protein